MSSLGVATLTQGETRRFRTTCVPIGPGEPRDTARSPKDVRKHKRGFDMRSNPTCQHTPTRGYQGTVLIHGSQGRGPTATPLRYAQFNVPPDPLGSTSPCCTHGIGDPIPLPSRPS